MSEPSLEEMREQIFAVNEIDNMPADRVRWFWERQRIVREAVERASAEVEAERQMYQAKWNLPKQSDADDFADDKPTRTP